LATSAATRILSLVPDRSKKKTQWQLFVASLNFNNGKFHEACTAFEQIDPQEITYPESYEYAVSLHHVDDPRYEKWLEKSLTGFLAVNKHSTNGVFDLHMA